MSCFSQFVFTTLGQRVSLPLFALGVALAGSQFASAVEVQEFLPGAPATALEWYASPITGSTPGSATIDYLGGMGGDLEFNQPSGFGAAHLTTGADNNDRAGATIANNFGTASLVLSDIDLSYWFHKVLVPGGNAAAAPSLKIGISNPLGTGGGNDDSYGQLIWEAAYQGSGNPTTGVWTQQVIDQDTGTGSTSSGGWWWSGGFGQASGGGGAPFRSLTEWNALFQGGTDSADYAGAFVSDIQIGVGSFNQNMDVYFDDLFISINEGSVLFSETYNFEAEIPAAPVPEPATMLMAAGLGLMGLIRRRRRAA